MERKKKRRRTLFKPIIALVAVLAVIVSGVFANLTMKEKQAEATSYGIKEMLDTNQCNFSINNAPVSEDTEYHIGDKFVYQLYWKVPSKEADGNTKINYQVGDEFYLDLPDFLISSL